MDEVASVVSMLKKTRRDHGRRMQAARERAGSLAQQHGETLRQFDKRYLAMSDAERELAGEASHFQSMRRDINEIIATLQNNAAVPWPLPHGDYQPPLLLEIAARYEAASKAADERYIAEVAARPVDDAAWQQELERRRHFEDQAAKGLR